MTETEAEKCRLIADQIRQIAQTTGAVQDEQNWISPSGDQVLRDIVSVDFDDVNPRFLNRLRLESHVFTGYRLTNILGETKVACWNDHFAGFFPAEGRDDVPDWCIPAFDEYTAGLAADSVFNPPLVMGEVGYRVKDCCVNRDVVSYQERVNLLTESGVLDGLLAKPKPVVVEIGAGYGGLAWFIKRKAPDVTYYIVDLPHALLFSSSYLTVALPDHAVCAFDGNIGDVKPGSLVCVVNRLLNDLKDIEIDLAINTLSFGEMPAPTVAAYAEFIRRNLASEGALFEQNFNNRGFSKTCHCDPRRVLRRYLAIKKIPAGRALWGEARLWGRKPEGLVARLLQSIGLRGATHREGGAGARLNTGAGTEARAIGPSRPTPGTCAPDGDGEATR